MWRKETRITLSLIIICLLPVFSQSVSTTEREIQIIEVRITKISWNIEKDNFLNQTVFTIEAIYLVNNTNVEDVVIYFAFRRNHFRINSLVEIYDKNVEVIQDDGGEVAPMGEEIIIPKRLSKGSTITKFIVYNENLLTLPDGKYTIWIGLDHYGESYFDSIRTLLIIRSGEPIFDFNYTPSNNLINKMVAFIPLFFFSTLAIIHFRKKRM